MQPTHPTVERLIDYVHHELSPRDDAAIHEHLSTCEECAQVHADEARLGEMLRQNARVQERELPPGLETAIFARAAAERSQPWRSRLTNWWRPLVALPIAAAIALIVYFGLPGRQANQPAHSSDAAYYMENHAALASTMPLGSSEAIPVMLTSDETAR